MNARVVKQIESESLSRDKQSSWKGRAAEYLGSCNRTQLLAPSTTNDAIEASARAHNAQLGQVTVILLKTANW